MNRIKIIGICVVSVVVIILASFGNVVGYQTVQSTNQNNIHKEINGKTIITVDDEPGDADFTSIKQAVNASSPRDTIEVYSGTYLEQGIRIEKNNVTLQGIAHELGGGNDSGKPFIKGDGTDFVITIVTSHVRISNFSVENRWGGNVSSIHGCISVGTDVSTDHSDIIISDCCIRNSPLEGIFVSYLGDDENIKIINNEIYNCSYGIGAVGKIQPFKSLTITGNNIMNSHVVGIRFSGYRLNISGNTLKRCGTGIDVYGACYENIIYGNDIDSCPVGIHITGLVGTGENIITKNNFKNYSFIRCWWKSYLGIYIEGLKLYHKNSWIGNYWDTWTGIGPQKILGKLTIWRPTIVGNILLPIPWFDHDRHPAKEPYEI